MSFISATCSGSTNVPDETGVSRLLVYLSLDVEARLPDRVETGDEFSGIRTEIPLALLVRLQKLALSG